MIVRYASQLFLSSPTRWGGRTFALLAAKVLPLSKKAFYVKIAAGFSSLATKAQPMLEESTLAPQVSR